MAVVDTKRTLPEWAQCVLEKVETLTQEAATAERHGNVVTLERVAALIRENAPVSTPEPSGQTLAGAGGEVAAFERWARGRFSGAEVFDRIESRPANEIGLTWEYNGYAVQSAWAAWIGRATLIATSAGTTGDDSARLDFIERTFSGMTNRERYLPVQMIWGKGCNGRTLREACDKYMKRDADAARRAREAG